MIPSNAFEEAEKLLKQGDVTPDKEEKLKSLELRLRLEEREDFLLLMDKYHRVPRRN